ncbi:hypothetical protein PP633_10010 [Mycobacteroides abscessus]|uniref:hypothetical protein n=1 Tax=Mycobacteroides abscessus TaxID=36809 RepID=UPI0002F8AE89|nr:hypothetical protein [Mycobacteroides abscessus]AMU74918.1 hypothetical protein A3O06_09895 [Mycobacteroides abscessus]ANO23860.1 hypothetical protein BAB79_09890 [Mycobacteroides abscessus]MDM2644218.1 hypothetical protein [Mycobacteroides abscessus]MDM2655516.1 hypothetical protein [Mycobacteroides abscessus]MDM2663430.1 hypothetical protein [Mycobacteroides abscessus]
MSADRLVENAKNGSLVLHLEDGAIDNILAACDTYKRALENLSQQAEALSGYPLGFSEGHLSSGAKLANAFQQKAAGGPTSAAATFKSHMTQVQEMEGLFVALRRGYASMDANNAGSYGRNGS